MPRLVVGLVASLSVLGCADAHPPRDGESTPDGSECLAIPRSNLSLAERLCQDWTAGACTPTGVGDLDEVAGLFTPTAIEPVDGGVRIRGRLMHIVGAFGDRLRPPLTVGPFQTGWEVTYELRLAGELPMVAIVRLDAITPREALDEYRTAETEREGQGRALCRRAGAWDVWALSDRAYFTPPPLWEDAQHVPVARLDESITLIERDTRRVWFVSLQGLPRTCEAPEPASVPPSCPARFSPEGAWVYLAVPVGTLEDHNLPDRHRGYCPIQPSCSSCCFPEDDIWSRCPEHGFHRCDENGTWLDGACSAMTLAEIPPPPAMHPCLYDSVSPCAARRRHCF